jgi:hypothetical protein
MANNNGIFNAVLSGAAGAVISGRWLNNPIAGAYDNVRLGALNLANAIDALIPTTITLTNSDFDLMKGIVQGAVGGRFAKATADVSEISVALVSLWTNVRAAILPVPLVPSPLVENLAWDGLANFTQIVLAAPHPAGMYLVDGVIDVLTPVGAGIITRHTSWTNGDGVVETNDNVSTISAANPGVQPQVDPPVTVISNGLGDITIEWQPGGVLPGADIDVFSVALYIGRRA